MHAALITLLGLIALQFYAVKESGIFDRAMSLPFVNILQLNTETEISKQSFLQFPEAEVGPSKMTSFKDILVVSLVNQTLQIPNFVKMNTAILNPVQYQISSDKKVDEDLNEVGDYQMSSMAIFQGFWPQCMDWEMKKWEIPVLKNFQENIAKLKINNFMCINNASKNEVNYEQVEVKEGLWDKLSFLCVSLCDLIAAGLEKLNNFFSSGIDIVYQYMSVQMRDIYIQRTKVYEAIDSYSMCAFEMTNVLPSMFFGYINANYDIEPKIGFKNKCLTLENYNKGIEYIAKLLENYVRELVRRLCLDSQLIIKIFMDSMTVLMQIIIKLFMDSVTVLMQMIIKLCQELVFYIQEVNLRLNKVRHLKKFFSEYYCWSILSQWRSKDELNEEQKVIQMDWQDEMHVRFLFKYLLDPDAEDSE